MTEQNTNVTSTENLRDDLKNEIILEMRNHLDPSSTTVLNRVLNKTLSNTEIIKTNVSPLTIEEENKKVIDLFLMNKAPKLSQKTTNYYMDSIKRLIQYTDKSLIRINSMDIEMFLDSITSTNDSVSINNHRRNISAFFTWMRKARVILENPCDSVEPFKEVYKPIDHLLPEEYEQLKSGCTHPRDRAMIEFMRSTAMRIGEIVGIKISDVDWNKGVLQIYANKTRSYRPVCLDSVAIKYLTEYINSRGLTLNSDGYLFTSLRDNTKPLNDSGMRCAIKHIAQVANMDRRVYPHLFRKTTATNIVKRGGSIHDAGEYLGHKDRSTAGQYYIHISNDHILGVFKRYVETV